MISLFCYFLQIRDYALCCHLGAELVTSIFYLKNRSFHEFKIKSIKLSGCHKLWFVVITESQSFDTSVANTHIARAGADSVDYFTEILECQI